MMTRPDISPDILYVVRHGQTEDNVHDFYAGRNDSPLTEAGIHQARRNGRALRRRMGSAGGVGLVSSPLGRALHTARLIASEVGIGAEIIETDLRLTELAFGAWEGRTEDEIERRYPGEIERRARDHWSYVIPGGESYEMLARRVGGWLDEMTGPAIVVTHGAVDRMIRGLYAGLPKEEIITLDEPQDVIFALADGRITRI